MTYNERNGESEKKKVCSGNNEACKNKEQPPSTCQLWDLKKKNKKKRDVRGTKSADQRVSERKLCMHRSYASLSGLPLHLDHHWMVVQTVVVRW